MPQSGTQQGATLVSVYSVVFRVGGGAAWFEVLNIAGERKTPGEIAKDLHAAAEEMELEGGAVDIG